MGTSYHVKAVLPDSLERAVAQQGIKEQLERIDALMSAYKSTSDVSRFNRSEPGEWVSVAAETVAVVEVSRLVSEQSAGAFDITVGPLVDVWGFGPTHAPDSNGSEIEQRSAPANKQIQQLLQGIGWQVVQVRSSPPALRKSKPVSIDLSAVAKGYAVDKAAEFLISKGVQYALVEVGGEVRAVGDNAGLRPWAIGIEKPSTSLELDREAEAVMHVKDIAVATSGDYRNYFEHDGRRYSHTIDPRTGYPVTHQLASVTVVAPSTALADAYATAIDVLGPEQGFAFAEKHNIPVFLLIKTEQGFTVRYTEPFGQYLH